jgi:hypothetical protein
MFGVMMMGEVIGYAQITGNVLAVKRGAVSLPMKDKVFPIVSMDDVSGNITVLAEGRKITVDGCLAQILSLPDAGVQPTQEVSV